MTAPWLKLSSRRNVQPDEASMEYPVERGETDAERVRRNPVEHS